MRPFNGGPRRQRGIALIIAMILVVLATILASKLTFDGFLEQRRTVGVLAAEQALQFGFGAEALAADVLVQDAQTGGPTTMAGPWAQPTAPLPISPQNDAEGEPIGTLQGSLEDMEGRFNLNNLAHMISPATAANAGGTSSLAASTLGGQTTPGVPGVAGAGTMVQDPQPLAQFRRLLVSVGLESKWAALARDWIDSDSDVTQPDGAEDSVYTSQNPPYRASNWPMTSPSELMNLPGFGWDRYRKIAPYVTALPLSNSKINICTAQPLVLESFADNLAGEWSGNPALVTNARKAGCFPDPQTFQRVLTSQGGASAATADIAQRIESNTPSSYFLLTTHVTLGTTEFTLYSLLNRSSKITPLLRSFGSY
jgi:general secretion pathway protein K